MDLFFVLLLATVSKFLHVYVLRLYSATPNTTKRPTVRLMNNSMGSIRKEAVMGSFVVLSLLFFSVVAEQNHENISTITVPAEIRTWHLPECNLGTLPAAPSYSIKPHLEILYSPSWPIYMSIRRLETFYN